MLHAGSNRSRPVTISYRGRFPWPSPKRAGHGRGDGDGDGDGDGHGLRRRQADPARERLPMANGDGDGDGDLGCRAQGVRGWGRATRSGQAVRGPQSVLHERAGNRARAPFMTVA